MGTRFGVDRRNTEGETVWRVIRGDKPNEVGFRFF